MTTDEALTQSLQRYHQLIEENQRYRNYRFQECMRKFKEHLQHEIRQVEDSLVNNEERNKLFSEIFESTYDRMMVGAEQIIRKMKNTYLQKKNFWKKIVEEHHYITSLQVKAYCYEDYMENYQKFYYARENERLSKAPYRTLLGPKQEYQNLYLEQKKNRDLETQINLTRKNSGDAWMTMSKTKIPVKPDSMIADQVIDKFMKTNNRQAMPPRPPSARPGSSHSIQRSDGLLQDFMRK